MHQAFSAPSILRCSMNAMNGDTKYIEDMKINQKNTDMDVDTNINENTNIPLPNLPTPNPGHPDNPDSFINETECTNELSDLDRILMSVGEELMGNTDNNNDNNNNNDNIKDKDLNNTGDNGNDINDKGIVPSINTPGM
jgi:hypothetical protein